MRPTLDAIVDGFASQPQLDVVEQHALECASCRRELDAARAVRAALEVARVDSMGGAVSPRDDDAFVDAVFAQVDTGSETAAPAPRLLTTPRLVAATLALAAASIALIVVGGSDGNEGESATDTSSALAPSTPNTTEVDPITIVDEGIMVEPQPLSVESHVDRREIDLAHFADVLRATASEARFDPNSTVAADEFVRAAKDAFDGDVRRAAREALRDENADPAVLRLSARALGPRADARDRSLLVDHLPELGTAAALALTDRGRTGVRELWSVAVTGAPGDDVALAALRRMVATGDGSRDPFQWIDEDEAPALSVAILGGQVDGGARACLARFLDGSGHYAWFDAWSSGVDASAVLAEAIAQDDGRTSASRRSRILRAIAECGAVEGLPVVVDALDEGAAGAIDAVAAIDHPDAVRAIFGLTARARLDERSEVQLWQRIADRRREMVLDVAFERSDLLQQRCTLLANVFLRADTSDLMDSRRGGIAHVLGELAASPELDTWQRIAILQSGLVRRSRAAAGLRDDADPLIAAAAWLATYRAHDAPTPPPDIAEVLARPGLPTARHARLVRVLERRAALRVAADDPSRF